MQPKPNLPAKPSNPLPEFAEPIPRKPLVLLRDTERSLRVKTVETLAPLLPEPLAINLGEASIVAEESLDQLAAIDLDDISQAELKPARIAIGLLFIGASALTMTFLLLVLYTLHPELSATQQMQQFWHQYIWFAGLGVAGLFMLGREAMRPPFSSDDEE